MLMMLMHHVHLLKLCTRVQTCDTACLCSLAAVLCAELLGPHEYPCQGPSLQCHRNKELLAVKIQKEDVDIITQEYEVDRKLAERRLREHSGNLKDALVSFL